MPVDDSPNCCSILVLHLQVDGSSASMDEAIYVFKLISIGMFIVIIHIALFPVNVENS